jgi:hypothetical protein
MDGQTASFRNLFAITHKKLHFIKFLKITNHYFPIQNSPNVLPTAVTSYSLSGTKCISMYHVRSFIIQGVNRKSFWVRSQNCEKRLSASSCLSVCLSVCLSLRIFVKYYRSIFQKYFRKIQTSLKPDKNNKYFTCRSTYLYDIILLNY